MQKVSTCDAEILMQKVSTCDATFMLKVSTFCAVGVRNVLTYIAVLLPDGALATVAL